MKCKLGAFLVVITEQSMDNREFKSNKNDNFISNTKNNIQDLFGRLDSLDLSVYFMVPLVAGLTLAQNLL